MMNKQEQQTAEHLWDSILWHKIPGPATKHTGIYKSWLEAYQDYGPPMTQEYDSLDQQGKPVIKQNFKYARCMWSDGKAHWSFSY
jgi:hypothetical protein